MAQVLGCDDSEAQGDLQCLPGCCLATKRICLAIVLRCNFRELEEETEVVDNIQVEGLKRAEAV